MKPQRNHRVPLERGIRSFRRRVAARSALARGARFVALWCFAWGTAVLALRAGFDAPREALIWGLAGCLPAAVAAVALALRERPAERAVRALFDLHNRGGGLMMADGEVELGGWRARLDAAAVPRLVARVPVGLLAGGALFVAAAFLMPVAVTGLEAERPLEVGRDVEDLAERIEVLKEESLLDDEQAERFERELEDLRQEALGDDPARTWETLDHLRETTDRTLADVSEAAIAEGEQLAAAEALAGVLSEAGETAGEERLAEAMAELSALTARAAADSRLLDSALAADLAAASEGGLSALSEALGQGRGGLETRLERLYAAGLIDLETLLAAKTSMEDDLEALAVYLDEQDLEASSSFCRSGRLASGRSGLPGRGGINRGRGDAAMTWREASSADGVSFREQILDPASLAALDDSRLLGLTAADPTRPEASAAATSPGALDPASAAGGGAAYTHTLLPRHRAAVRRFFDRPADER